MRFIGFEQAGQIFIGRMDEDQVVSLGTREEFWEAPMQFARGQFGQRLPLAGLKLRPTVRPSARVYCIGLNYRAHAEEAGVPVPKVPVVFSRWADTLAVDGEPSPAMDDSYDWEVELGVIIGEPVFAADPAEARAAVFGYCTFNDLSCRTYQLETSQWALGKNSERSGPMGPIVTADESGDPAAGWRLTTHVNDILMQDGSTADFIFDVPTILSHLSRNMRLNPGDMVVTGTPAGIGYARKPPISLRPGDSVTVEVQGLGIVTTPVVARTRA